MAERIFGAPRHLALIGPQACPVEAWPVPFDVGPVLAWRGRRVVMLASGDPFWFGAGGSITQHLAAGEWRAIPALSTFALAASRLGWPIEQVACLGLHAAALGRLRPHLAPGARAILLVRDGAAVLALAERLTAWGFGASALTVMEALGGPRERIRTRSAAALDLADIVHPVAVAVAAAGDGSVLPCASGIADSWFAHDGQITKRPVRALTLSALAPRPGERLWDIGGGSGSIAIEWLLSHPATQALAFERDPVRADRIVANAAALGVDRLAVVPGAAPDALAGHALPDAVFVGGGLTAGLIEWLLAHLPAGTRLVANAVTLETESLLAGLHRDKGGSLLRIDLAEAAPLGGRRGWQPARPLVQWSGAL